VGKGGVANTPIGKATFQDELNEDQQGGCLSILMLYGGLPTQYWELLMKHCGEAETA